jgi:hypothetical protein
MKHKPIYDLQLSLYLFFKIMYSAIKRIQAKYCAYIIIFITSFMSSRIACISNFRSQCLPRVRNKTYKRKTFICICNKRTYRQQTNAKSQRHCLREACVLQKCILPPMFIYERKLVTDAES